LLRNPNRACPVCWRPGRPAPKGGACGPFSVGGEGCGGRRPGSPFFGKDRELGCFGQPENGACPPKKNPTRAAPQGPWGDPPKRGVHKWGFCSPGGLLGGGSVLGVGKAPGAPRFFFSAPRGGVKSGGADIHFELSDFLFFTAGGGAPNQKKTGGFLGPGHSNWGGGPGEKRGAPPTPTTTRGAGGGRAGAR